MLPTTLTPVGDGFLLRTLTVGDIYLDSRMRKVWAGDLWESHQTAENKSRLGSLFTGWQYAPDGKIYAYGSMFSSDLNVPRGESSGLQNEKARFGFLRASLDLESFLVDQPEMLVPLADHDFYAFGFPVVAVTASHAYFLAVSASEALCSVYRIPLGASHAVASQVQFKGLALPCPPEISTPNTGPETEEKRYSELHSAPYPAAIIGRGDRLFVLLRRPQESNSERAEWTLIELDEAAEAVVSEEKLNTTSSEISLIPLRENDWIVLERGQVGDYGRQRIGSMKVLTR